jgi:hypothetical protein
VTAGGTARPALVLEHEADARLRAYALFDAFLSLVSG